jgi:ABC-type Zn uptake system ZnuABC Zn-binding protein ZnuA
VQVISLFTGALGPVGSDAGSYLGMMRANIDAIVAGVK